MRALTQIRKCLGVPDFLEVESRLSKLLEYFFSKGGRDTLRAELRTMVKNRLGNSL